MNAIARRTLGRYFHTFRFLAKLATGYIARFQVSGQLDIAGETLGSELSSCQDIMLIGRTLDMVPTSIAMEPIDEPRATEHASFTPLYHQIHEDLVLRIRSGHWVTW